MRRHRYARTDIQTRTRTSTSTSRSTRARTHAQAHAHTHTHPRTHTHTPQKPRSQRGMGQKLGTPSCGPASLWFCPRAISFVKMLPIHSVSQAEGHRRSQAATAGYHEDSCRAKQRELFDKSIGFVQKWGLPFTPQLAIPMRKWWWRVDLGIAHFSAPERFDRLKDPTRLDGAGLGGDLNGTWNLRLDLIQKTSWEGSSWWDLCEFFRRVAARRSWRKIGSSLKGPCKEVFVSSLEGSLCRSRDFVNSFENGPCKEITAIFQVHCKCPCVEILWVLSKGPCLDVQILWFFLWAGFLRSCEFLVRVCV